MCRILFLFFMPSVYASQGNAPSLAHAQEFPRLRNSCRTFPGAGPDGAIQAGLEKLVSTPLRQADDDLGESLAVRDAVDKDLDDIASRVFLLTLQRK
jgi:hypothetical protein